MTRPVPRLFCWGKCCTYPWKVWKKMLRKRERREGKKEARDEMTTDAEKKAFMEFGEMRVYQARMIAEADDVYQRLVRYNHEIEKTRRDERTRLLKMCEEYCGQYEKPPCPDTGFNETKGYWCRAEELLAELKRIAEGA